MKILIASNTKHELELSSLEADVNDCHYTSYFQRIFSIRCSPRVETSKENGELDEYLRLPGANSTIEVGLFIRLKSEGRRRVLSGDVHVRDDSFVIKRILELFGKSGELHNIIITMLVGTDSFSYSCDSDNSRENAWCLTQMTLPRAAAFDAMLDPDEINFTIALEINCRLRNPETNLVRFNRACLDEGEFYDLELESIQNQKFQCHREFVAAKSSVLSHRLKSCRKEGGISKLRLSCSSRAVKLLLNYMYYGSIDLEPDAWPLNFEILKSAHEYDIQDLQESVSRILCEKPIEWFTFAAALDGFLYTIKITAPEDFIRLKEKFVLVAVSLFHETDASSKTLAEYQKDQLFADSWNAEIMKRCVQNLMIILGKVYTSIGFKNHPCKKVVLCLKEYSREWLRRSKQGDEIRRVVHQYVLYIKYCFKFLQQQRPMTCDRYYSGTVIERAVIICSDCILFPSEDGEYACTR